MAVETAAVAEEDEERCWSLIVAELVIVVVDLPRAAIQQRRHTSVSFCNWSRNKRKRERERRIRETEKERREKLTQI